MAKTALVQASTDRTVPTTYTGTIEPNYYCRGWNAKRVKYCKARAGWMTTHPGVGRCKQHGGTQEGDERIKHGRYVTVPSKEIQVLLEHFANDPNPLSVIEELHLARAFLRRYVEKSGDTVDPKPVMDCVDTISKMVHRVEMLKTAGAVSLDQVRRFLAAVDRELQLYVTDEQLRDKLRHAFYAIRV